MLLLNWDWGGFSNSKLAQFSLIDPSGPGTQLSAFTKDTWRLSPKNAIQSFPRSHRAICKHAKAMVIHSSRATEERNRDTVTRVRFTRHLRNVARCMHVSAYTGAVEALKRAARSIKKPNATE